ncbi:MAG: hypothetical protein LBT59_03970 [Clostridiales bacterium]|nr:hypothetical protein [Clostridiales bacterium]
MKTGKKELRAYPKFDALRLGKPAWLSCAFLGSLGCADQRANSDFPSHKLILGYAKNISQLALASTVKRTALFSWRISLIALILGYALKIFACER